MLGRVQTFVSKYESAVNRRLDVIEFIEVAEVLDMDIVRIIRKLKATNEE